MHGSPGGMGGPGGPGPMGGPGGHGAPHGIDIHYGGTAPHVNASALGSAVGGAIPTSVNKNFTVEPTTNTVVCSNAIDALSAIKYAQISIIMGGLLLLANFLGAYIWKLGPFILDGGVIVFPAVYVCGDILMEIWKKDLANKAESAMCWLNIIALVACFIVSHLPSVEDAGNVDLMQAFGLSGRVMFASVIGFWVSCRINNFVFHKLYEKAPDTATLDRTFCRRALISSFFGRILDTLLFNTIAFGGRLTIGQLFAQMLSAFVAASIIETLMYPITKRIRKRILNQFRALAE